MVFHLVSRLHRREPLFVPELRGVVASLIPRVVGQTDAQLLAYVVMPNHIHVVLRQGRTELAGIMQPLLRRVALRVQAWHGFEGTVVERRFRDRLCQTPDHVREAIVYVHLNPWRADLCDATMDYPWMTHGAYLPGATPSEFGLDSDAQGQILELFAQRRPESREQLCEDYLSMVRWRMWLDQLSRDPIGEVGKTLDACRPDFRCGDRAWKRQSEMRAGARETGRESGRPDLKDFVDAYLGGADCDYQAAELRGSPLSRERSRCRARVIRAAAGRGYRTGAIARFFDVSPATVSGHKYATE